MGEITHILLFILLHVSLLLNSVVAVNPSGLTLRMIHRDSKESPFSLVNGHLTQEERFERLVKQSEDRAYYISLQMLLQNNATSSIKPDVVRVPVVYETRWYVGLVGIGTFPNRPQPFLNYYLMIDSGSDLTWLQCKGATNTFNQDLAQWPLYPWEESTSYVPLHCPDHSVFSPCNKCNARGECIYLQDYASGAVTSGVIARENFTINSDIGGPETLRLLMGCGLNQENFRDIGNNHRRGNPDLIAGILGLGRGPYSFLNELGPVGQGKFAYCLEKYNKDIQAGNTYLRFGEDATIGGEVRTTPIIEPTFRTSLYFLNLEGISVGGNRASLTRDDFKIKGTRGGCIIDSGSPFTSMYKDHFDRLASVVAAYFQHIGARRDYSTGSSLCFFPPTVENLTLPIITFHFQQEVEYKISETGFVLLGEKVCLAIGRKDTDTPSFILGAYQQTNKRILYDNGNLALSFADEECKIGF